MTNVGCRPFQGFSSGQSGWYYSDCIDITLPREEYIKLYRPQHHNMDAVVFRLSYSKMAGNNQIPVGELFQVVRTSAGPHSGDLVIPVLDEADRVKVRPLYLGAFPEEVGWGVRDDRLFGGAHDIPPDLDVLPFEEDFMLKHTAGDCDIESGSPMWFADVLDEGVDRDRTEYQLLHHDGSPVSWGEGVVDHIAFIYLTDDLYNPGGLLKQTQPEPLYEPFNTQDFWRGSVGVLPIGTPVLMVIHGLGPHVWFGSFNAQHVELGRQLGYCPVPGRPSL